MKKLVIFDFDGTLADTKAVAYPIYVRVATEHQLPILPESDIYAMSELPLKERLKKMRVNLFRLPSLLKSTRAAVRYFLPEVNAFEGMKDGLMALDAKGVNLAIVSSNAKENIEQFMRDKGINLPIDVHGGASLFSKASMIKRLLKKRNLQPSDCLYVGDESRDIEACLSLGIEVIAVSYGYDSYEHLASAKPTYLETSPQAMFARIHTFL